MPLPRGTRGLQTVPIPMETVMRTRHAAMDGFTLTELLIVLAIAAITLMIGAPAMGSLIARSHASGAEASIADSLRHARTTAVMHNTRVLVCPSRDGRRCLKGDDWQYGWIVANDADHDGQPDTGVQALATIGALPAGTRIITSAGRGQLAFQPSGSAGGSNVTFTVCHTRDRNGKSVVVANSGRVRIDSPDAAHLQACLAGFQQ